ncbi:hypothetical protein MPSI1_003175 [Malassezia psittaci]|uniref:Uncharacterized protein n=1 Tax=Malassezia psittaci TaxID=1821823 RepID=A0AAF0FBY4_9BASI|nr:hypothetical protein MPSI1_003175 [Malassezia psittaci]
MVKVELDDQTRETIIPHLKQLIENVNKGGVPAYEKEVSRLQASKDIYHEKGNDAGSWEDEQFYNILINLNHNIKVQQSIGTAQHRDELIHALEKELNRLEQQ